MVLHLNEQEVRSLVSMDLALAAVEESLRALGTGKAENAARRRFVPSIDGELPNTTLQLMSASLPEQNVMGYKAYTTSPSGTRFLVMLYGADSGQLLAAIEADWLGRYRTGAASGVATKYLARTDSRTVGLYGTGGQSLTQLLAICTVRPSVESVRVFSRSPENRERFASRFTKFAPHMPIEIQSVDEPRQAADGVDVIITITNARYPVLKGDWLKPGVHINAAGINRANAAEVDAEAVHRADLVAVDVLDQAQTEAGDLLAAEREGMFRWSDAVELGTIVSGQTGGRTVSNAITLFESQGLAIEDVALAARLYDLAQGQGMGRRIPFWEA